jgi:putative ABC transport system ATP-binding protein
VSNILEAHKVFRKFKSGSKTLTVVNDINFSIQKGISCAIVGPSGSGKTTLLGLCAGLDRPTSGRVTLNGIPLNPFK